MICLLNGLRVRQKIKVTKLFFPEGIPDYAKNQLPFLVDAKPEEVSAEKEAEEVTKVADSAVQATNVLETEFGEPIELTKEEDIASDNEFVYFYSKDVDKFRGKTAPKRLLRVKASQAHLINEYVKKKGLKRRYDIYNYRSLRRAYGQDS